MGELHQIGLKYGTDKAAQHKYCDFYEKFFKYTRNLPINILEIGTYRGQSLKMFIEYFSKAEIYTIDIEDNTHWNLERTHIAVCNQEKRDELNKIFPTVQYNIILDDGGHTMRQQQISLGILFKRLLADSIYIIEDLHTSTQPVYRDGLDYGVSTLYMLEEFVRTGKIKSVYLTEDEIKYLEDNIKTVIIFSTNKGKSITSIIIKK